MKIHQISSSYNITNFKNSDVDSTKTTSNIEKTANNKKIAMTLVGLAAAGAAIIAGTLIYKGQATKAIHNTQNSSTKLLSDICFSKGTANLKNGEKFTGIVKDTLKNGDKITLEYADGILMKSSRSGSKTFEKIYETLENGKHKITTIKDDKISSVIIEDLQNAAKKSQDKLKALFENKDKLSIEKFQKQADEIKFKSKKQADELKHIIKDKQKALDEQKIIAKEVVTKYKDSAEKLPELLKGAGWKEAFPEEVTQNIQSKIKSIDDPEIERFMSLKDYTYENNINEALSGEDRLNKFYMMAQNASEQSGSAAYIDEIPKMFEGIDKETLAKDIDKSILNLSIFGNEISIGGKQFKIEEIGGGQYSKVYKISDGINKPLALKTSITCNRISHPNEILLAKQFKDANVVDVPKFYAGNPLTEFFHNPQKEFGHVAHRPAWILSDCVSPDDIIPKDGLKLFDYLKSVGGGHYDLNNGSFVGDFIVDLGGIRGSKNLPGAYSEFIDSFAPILQEFGYSVSDTTKLLSQVHK